MTVLGVIGKWLVNVAIGVDQLANAVLGGDPDETISSRLGKMRLRYGGKIPWHRPLSKIVDWGLDKIDRDHSIEAIESDEGSAAVLDRDRKHKRVVELLADPLRDLCNETFVAMMFHNGVRGALTASTRNDIHELLGTHTARVIQAIGEAVDKANAE